MISLKVKLDKVKPALIRSLAGSLKMSRVLVLPTDTIFGLSCAAGDVRAIKKIYRLKGRNSKKPALILVSDFKMLKQYARVSRAQEKLLRRIWLENKRPTTVILEAKDKLPGVLISASKGLAVRLPKSDFLIKIVRALRQPLVSTSVNKSGRRNLTGPKEIKAWFKKKKNRPDLIIDSGQSRRRRESRLLDLRNPDQVIIIRK